MGQWLRWCRDFAHDFPNNRICRQPFGQGFIRQHKSVTQYVGHQVCHVLRQGITAAAQHGQRAGAFGQVDGGTRAGAEGDELRQALDAVLFRIARGGNQLDGVLHQRRIDVNPAAFRLQGCELLGGGHTGYRHSGTGDALHDDELFFISRVVHQHLHHEAVNLGLGQGVSAFSLNRVLCGHDKEGRWHFVCHAGDGDLALLHHFEQGTLHLGRCAVDFVSQQQVGEYRAQRGGEFTGLLVVDTGADQISWYEVGCELYALEVAAHGVGQSLDGQGLGQAGHALHQQMPLRQDGHHDALEEAVLADHHTFDLIKNLLHQLGGVLIGWGVFRVERVHGDPSINRCFRQMWSRRQSSKMPQFKARTVACPQQRPHFQSARQSLCRQKCVAGWGCRWR